MSEMPPPRLVFWETTRACNLRCAHCRRLEAAGPESADGLNRSGYSAGSVSSGGELSSKDALTLVGAVAETGRPILVLSGGEPLLRPDIFDIAGRAVSLGLTVSLATNGTLVDDAAAEQIAACGIRRVAISLDGPDAASHDAFRGEAGCFDKALAGFGRLKRRGVSLQINTTVTRGTLGRVEEMYGFALRLGADALHVFSLVPVGCGAEIAPEAMLSAAESERLLLWIARKAAEGRIQMKATCAPQYFRIAQTVAWHGKLRDTEGTAGVGAGRPGAEAAAGAGGSAGRYAKGSAGAAGMPDGEARRGGAARGGSAPGGGDSRRGQPEDARGESLVRAAHPSGGDALSAATKGCLAGTGVCFISSAGEVFPCGYLPISCGNVRERPFREIWESSPVLLDLRDPDRLKGKCGRCGFKLVCGGCRARAYAVRGDYLAEEPSCAYLPP